MNSGYVTGAVEIIEKITGEKKTAIYGPNRFGNKQFNVDGKFYSDKKFGALFTVLGEDIGYQLKVHVKKLFEEILTNNSNMAIMKIPFMIFYNILQQAAIRAAEIQDEKMIGFMCRLGMYEFSDPSSKEYNQNAVKKYIESTK